MMMRMCLLAVLLMALAPYRAVSSTNTDRQVLQPGSDFSFYCPLTLSGVPMKNQYTQFYIFKVEIKMFNTRISGSHDKLLSNDTVMEPVISEHTDRYSVIEKDDRYTLKITNVTESDSAIYACRIYNLVRDSIGIYGATKELLVPGPFRDLFWTSNFTGLNTTIARKHEIPDGNVALVKNKWTGSHLACAILVSNLEPVVTITIGHPDEPDSVDVTDDYEARAASEFVTSNVGAINRETVFFTKKFSYRESSVRNLYCRASLLGTTFTRSVNAQFTMKAPNMDCKPYDFLEMVGDRNVNLSCLIPAHPEPEVTWTIPDGTIVTAASNNPNFTVTNEARFEGLLTTLTITEVTEDLYEEFLINATNTEGEGTLGLRLWGGRREPNQAAGLQTPVVSLITSVFLLILMKI